MSGIEQRYAATSEHPYAVHITYLAGFDSTRYPTWESAGITSASFGALVERIGSAMPITTPSTSDSVTRYQARPHPAHHRGGSGGDNAAPTVDITAPADGAVLRLRPRPNLTLAPVNRVSGNDT